MAEDEEALIAVDDKTPAMAMVGVASIASLKVAVTITVSVPLRRLSASLEVNIWVGAVLSK